MPTCGDLLTEATAQLHGWGSTQDQLTFLAAPVATTDTTITVTQTFGQAVGITPGVVEIDSELIYITSADPNTGICTVAQRGFSGSAVKSHLNGAKVTSQPKFPRWSLFNQINEIIGAVYPDLFAVATHTDVVTTPSYTYNLPGDPPMDILRCQWQDPVGNWVNAFSYQVDPYDGTFQLGSGPWVGRPLRVLYTTQPAAFSAETDDFETTTGLPASCADVLTLGVVSKQVPGLDISRAQLTSVEASDRSRVVPPNQGINAAKYLMAEYQERLANEAQALRRQYKPRIVRKW